MAMQGLRLLSIAIIATTACQASTLAAREVDRAELAENFVEDVPQEKKVFCRDTQVFTLTDGSEVRACVDWRAQVRTRLLRTYAALDGPETDNGDNLTIARECFDLAVAAANDPLRTSFDENLILAKANAEFSACARARNLLRRGSYSLRIYRRGVWLGGS
jgi:hypothetical protein